MNGTRSRLSINYLFHYLIHTAHVIFFFFSVFAPNEVITILIGENRKRFRRFVTVLSVLFCIFSHSFVTVDLRTRR